MVAFGLVRRSEERFDATPQTQAHDSSEDAAMSVPTTKRSFVVQLLDPRQPQARPGLNQVVASRRTGFVAVLVERGGMREQIEGVEVLNLGAPVQMPGDNVGGMHGIAFGEGQPRIVRRRGCDTPRMGQALAGQDPLNRGLAGQWRDMPFVQLGRVSHLLT